MNEINEKKPIVGNDTIAGVERWIPESDAKGKVRPPKEFKYKSPVAGIWYRSEEDYGRVMGRN